MRRIVRILVLALGLAAAHLAAAENLSVSTSDGRAVAVVADFPPGGGRFAAVVLAPGQGYHMALPAMEATSQALVAQGLAVFRFNWAYFSTEPRGRPSADLSKELLDLQAVMALARGHAKVAPDQLIVGGKSLGSLVAWRALATDRQLRGALLLTPVCSRLERGETTPRAEALQNYPGFADEQRPSLWVSGHKDPLCAAPLLYGFAAGSRAARVAIVGGDHGFEDRSLPPAAGDSFRTRTLAAVSAVAAAFAVELSGGRP